jgi:Uma2 family endonuclease
MVSTTQKNNYTEQEYLELERNAEYKSEFFKGEIFARATTPNNHNLISGNFLAFLFPKLRDQNCRPYNSDMRIHIPINSFYAYPDISVVCGEKKFLDNVFDTLLNPVFICEVLSKSTADYDTGGKFMRYRSMDSLKEYWVVSSLEYRLQKFVKQANGNWLLSETTNVNDTVEIECLSTEIPLKEIYFEVEF